MSDKLVLIVGAGQAGFQAAMSLRQEGFQGEVRIVGEEKDFPYQRPPLSKTYLKEAKAERLTFRRPEYYQQNLIDIRTGVRVDRIDRRLRTVKLDNGESVPFDHLIIATGARNRALPLAGMNAPNVVELRTLSHADMVREQMARSARIAVLGGGFIGLEFAALANSLGKSVAVIEMLPRLMARAVSLPISEFFLQAHRAAGIDVRLGTAAVELETASDGSVDHVLLSSGDRVSCDMVLIAAGVLPNSEIAQDAGLKTDNGIVVDAYLATSDPHISAVGDCVSFEKGGSRLRLESVQNAVDQARCVARRLVGRPEPYAKVPWFWSDQGDYKLQIAGLVRPSAHTIVHTDGEAGKVSVFSFEEGRLTAVETVNRPGDHLAARKALEAGKVEHSQLREVSYDLKRLSPSRQHENSQLAEAARKDR